MPDESKPYTPEDWAQSDNLDPSRVAATVSALERAERERDEARHWLSVQHDVAADHPHMHTLGHHEHSCTLARLHAMRVALDVAERCVEERDAARTERDEETRKRYVAEAMHDLMAREKERAEHAHNALLLTVGPLKAALRDIVVAFDAQVARYRANGDHLIAGIAEQTHGARMKRAREALGEVE